MESTRVSWRANPLGNMPTPQQCEREKGKEEKVEGREPEGRREEGGMREGGRSRRRRRRRNSVAFVLWLAMVENLN